MCPSIFFWLSVNCHAARQASKFVLRRCKTEDTRSIAAPPRRLLDTRPLQQYSYIRLTETRQLVVAIRLESEQLVAPRLRLRRWFECGWKPGTQEGCGATGEAHGTPPLYSTVEDVPMKLKFAWSAILAAMLLAVPAFVQAAPAQPAPRRIEVTAKRFAFSPSEITLKKGEPVLLVLTSADVAHGIRFKELGIETKVGKGQTSELAFTPEVTGTFVGHCYVFCGAGHGEMTLILHVVE